ncbi:hypothetical protein F9C07_2070776, partial [Aspergillus flavus]
TLPSISKSNFIQPPPSPPIPKTLQRVGLDRTKVYILYSNISKNKFVAWWLRIDFGRKKRIY